MRKLMALLGLSVVLLGACGGSDNKTDTNASGTTTTAEASSAGANAATFTDFCGAKAAFGASAAATDANALKNAAANMDKAVSYAPSEIKADVKTVVDASKPFIELMASANYDYMKLASDPAKQQQLQALAAKFNESGVTAAAERINAWVAAHCK